MTYLKEKKELRERKKKKEEKQEEEHKPQIYMSNINKHEKTINTLTHVLTGCTLHLPTMITKGRMEPSGKGNTFPG